MTCIAAVIKDGNIYMGGDSRATDDWGGVSTVPKVFRKNNFIMGLTGSGRSLQLLQYQMQIPTYHADEDLMTYMVTEFAEAMRGTLKNGGDTETENGCERSHGHVLVGFKGHLFDIGADYLVQDVADDYCAVGSGGDCAKGSLYSTSDLEPEERVRKALEAACKHNAYCSAPFQIETLKGDTTNG